MLWMPRKLWSCGFTTKSGGSKNPSEELAEALQNLGDSTRPEKQVLLGCPGCWQYLSDEWLWLATFYNRYVESPNQTKFDRFDGLVVCFVFTQSASAFSCLRFWLQVLGVFICGRQELTNSSALWFHLPDWADQAPKSLWDWLLRGNLHFWCVLENENTCQSGSWDASLSSCGADFERVMRTRKGLEQDGHVKHCLYLKVESLGDGMKLQVLEMTFERIEVATCVFLGLRNLGAALNFNHSSKKRSDLSQWQLVFSSSLMDCQSGGFMEDDWALIQLLRCDFSHLLLSVDFFATLRKELANVRKFAEDIEASNPLWSSEPSSTARLQFGRQVIVPRWNHFGNLGIPGLQA